MPLLSVQPPDQLHLAGVVNRVAGDAEHESECGLFADALVTRFVLLRVEEGGRLCDPRLRENFVERIFAFRRLTALFAARWSMGDVVRFHTAHKLSLMARRSTARTGPNCSTSSGTMPVGVCRWVVPAHAVRPSLSIEAM